MEVRFQRFVTISATFNNFSQHGRITQRVELKGVEEEEEVEGWRAEGLEGRVEVEVVGYFKRVWVMPPPSPSLSKNKALMKEKL